MEENNTSINTSSSPTKNPDHGRDPSPPAAAYGGGNNQEDEEKDPETIHEPKRRKTSPILLDKQKSSFHSSFSFFCGGVSTPETTPKFGSFNLVAESTKIKRPKKDEDDEETEASAVEKAASLSEFDSPDGIETAI